MMKKNTALCIVAVMLLSLTAVAFAEEAKTPSRSPTRRGVPWSFVSSPDPPSVSRGS